MPDEYIYAEADAGEHQGHLLELNAYAAWETAKDLVQNRENQQETVVAVLDSGVDADHEDLKGRLFPSRSW